MLPSLIQFSEPLDEPLSAFFSGVLGNVQQLSDFFVSHFLGVPKIDKAPIIRVEPVYQLGQLTHIGNGEVIEAMGTKYGVVKTQLEGRGWTHWLEIPYINYA